MVNDLSVKVRTYKLDCTMQEFGNTNGNQKVFEKTDTTPSLNAVFNRDIYLTFEGKQKIDNFLFKNTGKPIDDSLISFLENSISYFIKDCFSKDQAYFSKPDEPYYKIDGEYYFEHY